MFTCGQRYDENKLPRTWSPDLDINALYVDARVQALKLLEIFSDPSDELTIQGLPIYSLSSDQVEPMMMILEVA